MPDPNNPVLRTEGMPGALPLNVVLLGPSSADRATGLRVLGAGGSVTVELAQPLQGLTTWTHTFAQNEGAAVNFKSIVAADAGVWPIVIEFLGIGLVGEPVEAAAAIAGVVEVEGTGAPGAPAGGVLSIQGVPGGTEVPVNDATLNAKFPGAAAPANNATNDAVSIIATRLQGWNGARWDLIAAGQTAVTATPLGFANGLPFGQYLAAPAALADGQWAPLLLDTNHRVMLSAIVSNFPSTQDVEGVGVAGAPAGGVLTIQGDPGGEHVPTQEKRLMPPNASLFKGAASNQFTVRGSQGTLWVVTAEGTTATDLWLQFFDAVALPVNGTFADLEVQIPQTGLGTVCLDIPHDFATNGIFAAVSSTPDALTLAAGTPAIIRAKHTAIGA